MKKVVLLILSIFFLNTSYLFSQNNKLWFDKPASVWTEALPIGNGFMGAMVFGNPEIEHLQLNEGTLYTGDPHGTFKNINIRKSFKVVTDLLNDKKYQEAQAIIAKEWLGRNHQLYQPMGDLWIDFEHKSNAILDYKRNLNLTNATASTSYKIGKTTFKRTYFASYPDHVIVIKLQAVGLEKINCTLRFTTPHQSSNHFEAKGNSLSMQGKVAGFGLRRSFEQVEKLGDQHKYPELYDKWGKRKPEIENMLYDEKAKGLGMTFESAIKAYNDGGSLVSDKDKIIVKNANELVLILSSATSFNGFDKSPAYEGKDPRKLIEKYFKAIQGKSFNVLYKNHLSDYKKLYDRVELKLAAESKQSKLPTDKRIALFFNKNDPSFPALYFNYGRYLMIAGSRIGGQPLNLQGIWNDQMIPPWNGAYTININAQMNYWPAEITHLSECQEPFFQAIKELAINGQETARNMFVNDGWVAHHNTDIWRHTEPVDNCNCSFWPMAAGWLTSHFWEKYLYNGDKRFLKVEVFPLLKGAVQFYQGWLVKNENGYLVTPIGHSPEQNFLYEQNKQGAFSAGPTMDMAIIRESMSRYIEACTILGIDEPLLLEVKHNLRLLLPYQIGKYGQLQEWQEDFEDADVQHRHFSHLYAFHPSNQINWFTPELISAVKKVMERRGDLATGWSMGWKVNIWARLQDGDHALKLLTNLFKLVRSHTTNMEGGGTYPNLFDAHPPFQIDGNFGATAGIAEMLIQSHAGEIYLLPALPKEWHTGNVKGLRVRGGFEIDMAWKNGKLIKIIIYSKIGGNCRIRTKEKLTIKDLKYKIAKGENPNQLFTFVKVEKPLIKDPSNLLKIEERNSFAFDFLTKKGKKYEIL
nr:glycoside hydrolase family 95 protein [uncultured Emticicia sp.]